MERNSAGGQWQAESDSAPLPYTDSGAYQDCFQRRLQKAENESGSAEWYDQIRPGYPEALIDDVIFLSAIPPAGQILEIGCGTGKATEMFASRGYSLFCLDLGADLAAVAVQKFRGSDNVQIALSSFEEWESL